MLFMMEGMRYIFDILEHAQTFSVFSYNYLDLADAVDALNERYGAKNPDVEDIIFTNGLLDPYYSFGITEYSNNNSHVFNIPRKLMRSLIEIV